MGLLGGVLTGILGGSEANPTDASPNGGLGIPLPSLPGLPGLPSLSLPIPPIFPTDSASLPGSSSAPPAPPASASSVPLSVSSVPSAPPTSSSLAPPSSSFTPTSTSSSASPTATSLPDVSTDNNGVVHTVSHVIVETAAASTTEAAAAPAHHESFLENKALSGTIFALAGLVALVLLVVLATWVFRRRRRNRLLDDAVSFDPSLLPTADRYDGSEKGHSSNASLGTLGSGRPTGYGTTYQAEPIQQYNPYGGVQQQPAYYGAPQPAHQPEYYGDYGAPQPAQQPYYSAYVPPMNDAPPSTLAATTHAPAPRATHNIPRVPVPAKPLPEEFGSSDQNNRTSVEESEFWAKTLKVANE